MRFMFWSTGRRPGQEVASRVKSLSLATLLAVLGLAVGARDVQAQANPAQILEAGAAATTPSGTPAAREEAGDPVSRFLADKGLLNTRPVSELAQQVRDKATDLASDLVISAMDFLGVPYRRGGDSKSEGFDCSGFTRHVFERSIGMILPRRAAMPGLEQVRQAELKPGDLVFFNTLRHTFSHVGIYIGDNKFIHSPRAGGAVRIEDMRIAYWQQRFDGARRVPTLTASQVSASALLQRANADAAP
jgi:cell wall-associated NlpC family hydrolase